MARPLLAFVAVLVVGAIVLWRPFLTREHEVLSATPAPIALYEPTTVALRPGATACLHGVTFAPDAEVAGFTADGPLVVTAAAPGYRARAVGRDRVAITPPRRSVTGRLCLRNAGRRPVAIAGTTDPGSTAPPVTTIDGRPIAPDIALALYERAPASDLARAGEIVRHAAALAWSPGVLWVLVLLVLVGVPGAIAYGFALSLRD